MEHAQHTPRAHGRTPLILGIALAVVIGGGAAGVAYMAVSSQKVYIEKSSVTAPEIPLSPTAAGTLQAVLVSPGDTIQPGAVVAQVGTELVKSTLGGLVVSTNTNIGAQIPANTPVVTMIDPSALRVVGRLDEDKGLVDIKVGDRAVFTVDAYGSRKFTGVVSEISPTSQQSDVAFSISDKREVKSFDVKVSYDASAYPAFRNGMSARIWVYKN